MEYAPFLAILALANVIECPIHVFTKTIADKRLLNLYNNMIYPFESNDNAPIHLFWGSTSTNDRLDHFVPFCYIYLVFMTFINDTSVLFSNLTS